MSIYSTTDVDPDPTGGIIMIHFDSTEYHVPTEKADVWLRTFRDALDGSFKIMDGGPDIELVDTQPELYSVVIGGTSEMGSEEFYYTQNAYFDRPTLRDFTERLEKAVMEL